jgi:hypothetical protein
MRLSRSAAVSGGSSVLGHLLQDVGKPLIVETSGHLESTLRCEVVQDVG